GERDRFGQQRHRVVRGEDGRGVVEGEVYTGQVKWVAVKVAGQLRQLLAQRPVGIDPEIGTSHVSDRLRSAPEGLKRVEDPGPDAPLLGQRPQGAAVLGT